MSSLRNPRKPDDGSSDVLTDVTRRRIVHIVHGRTGAIPERKLAERLATAEQSPESGGAADEAVRSSRIRLRHVHLPELVDAGLVEWDQAARTVEVGDNPLTDARRSETSDPADSSFGTDRQRDILAIVESADGPVSRERLARELASREADGRPTDARIEEVTVRLHHRHIPKLQEADLIEYDSDSGTVERA